MLRRCSSITTHLHAFIVIFLLCSPILGGGQTATSGSTPSDRARPDLVVSKDEYLEKNSPLRLAIDLSAGTDLRINSEQSDCAVRIHVTDPAGNELLQRLTPIKGLTPIAVVVKTAGKYSISIEMMNGGDSPCELRIQLMASLPKGDEALHETRASALLSEGDQLASRWTSLSLSKAVGYYSRAVENWKLAGDSQELAAALERLAEIQAIRKGISDALPSFREAESLEADQQSLADLLVTEAHIEVTFHHYRAAEEKASMALRICEAQAYEIGKASALTELGAISFYDDKEKDAESFLSDAEKIWSDHPNRAGEAHALIYRSYIASRRSQFGPA